MNKLEKKIMKRFMMTEAGDSRCYEPSHSHRKFMDRWFENDIEPEFRKTGRTSVTYILDFSRTWSAVGHVLAVDYDIDYDQFHNYEYFCANAMTTAEQVVFDILDYLNFLGYKTTWESVSNGQYVKFTISI